MGSDDRIKALAAIAGPLVNGTGRDHTETYQCSRSLPVLHFHGLADPIVPFTGCNATSGGSVCENLLRWPGGGFAPMGTVNDYITAWRVRNGVDQAQGSVTFQNQTCTCTSWGESANNVTLCTLKDEGHAWPGSCTWMNKVSPWFACTMDADASQQAMAFFRNYIPSKGFVV